MTATDQRPAEEPEQDIEEHELAERDGTDPGHADDEASRDGGNEELRARVDELSSELESVRNRHLRLAAEFDNYRKRARREQGELGSRAKAEIVETLLETIDDLERVTGTDIESTPADALREGVLLVERKLIRALESAGLEPVEAEGEPFDPEVHEALMTTPAETEEEDNMVADVLQRGYRLGDLLLRPARVRVKKYEGGNGNG